MNLQQVQQEIRLRAETEPQETWQYCQVTLHQDKGRLLFFAEESPISLPDGQMTDVMNELGAQGWEMVSMAG